MSAKATIILLEDDVALRGLIADGLRDQDYTVVEATSIEGASRAIRDVDGRAVLVADRSVGEHPANGFDAAAKALDTYPALRAVYISGAHVALRNRKLSGRERSLLKPFALSQLVAEVRQLGG